MELKRNNWKNWLIQSTFDNDLPETLCGFVLLFVVSLILIPFAWISHAINLIRGKIEYNAFWGIGFLFFGGCIQCAILFSEHFPEHGVLFTSLMHKFSPMTQALICYFTAPFGILFLLIFVVILGLLFLACELLIKKFVLGRFFLKMKEVKRKHCVKINYTE